MRLGSFCKNSCWLLAIGCWPEGKADFEIPGSKLDAAVAWAWSVTPPVFGVALSLTMRGHYTRKVDGCQMLNEISRGYLPQKAQKAQGE